MSGRLVALAWLPAVLLLGCEVKTEMSPGAPARGRAAAAPSGAAAAAQERSNRSHLAAESHNSKALRFVRGYEAGYREATATGKPMLLFFTAQWCHFCHQMCDEAFANPQVLSLSERFVCILVDADDEPAVCQKFRVQGYPTVQFLSPRGVPLNRLVGKKPGQQVREAMQAALQNVAQHAGSTRQR